ncbi:MAG TPA: aminotransferase class I/II-fold pyridoxal phosphate-dependent enzyme [Thermoanaerobaculia bacterium]|nr:aminotransferase class I/II-fold pyridoxal phosphate-dependent enzyme [Thermoanaerobaculia bacterium]
MSVQRYISGVTAVKIAASVEEALAAGRAAGGDPLPPVRALADRLSVSPATAAAAYRLLRERGVIVADGRRGTRIRPAPPVAALTAAPLPAGVRDLSEGNPDPRLLPDVQRVVRTLPVPPRVYGDELNDAGLLALAKKQFAADGVPSAHVAVVSGALDGIERVLREHLRPGDRVAVEDPCFTGVADLLAALSLVAVPVPVDDEGILPEALPKTAALIVTPRAQNPTGAAFSERRARRVRAVLKARPEMLVIEDDHAGPVAGASYVTLVDAARERWAVVRSVSKSLGPDLRVALLAGDAATVARVEGRQTLGIRWVSHLLQTLVAALWRDRRVQRQLARAERTYAERRHALLAALRARGIEAHGTSRLNVWIPLPEESAAVQALMRKGWAVKAGERYRLRSEPAIRVTIASLEPRDAVRFADDVAALFGTTRRTSAA